MATVQPVAQRIRQPKSSLGKIRRQNRDQF
jgi:hypothetical protein